MTRTVPAYGARKAREPLAPMTIERRDTGPRDVAIDILYCGICHSDLHKAYDEWQNTHFPVVPGHEIVGRVREVGKNVPDLAPGALVAVGCMVDSCRRCAACRSGNEMFCEKGATITFGSYEEARGAWTQGGYSREIVVDRDFVLCVPSGLDPARAAPLLCAGITTYSPLRRYGCGPGKNVAIVGLGGLGHIAVKLAHAMGAEVTVLSTSRAKEQDANRLGARHFVATSEPGALEPLKGQFDLILDTVGAAHNMDVLTELLRSLGTLVLVGLPPPGAPVDASGLIHGNKAVAGSNIGGIRETQELLDWCGPHQLEADVEVIPATGINEAYGRMVRGDVRYRFVIDAETFAMPG